MSRKPKETDGPDHPGSAGWTEAQTARLCEAGQFFKLESGGQIAPVDIEFETYGRLSPAKDNAVLICHALSGDAHAAGWDKKAEASGRVWRVRKPGWWDSIIGPGKPLDTAKYFFICSNFLGSCYGTTGPSSVNPATQKPYGLSFPLVTVSDWVKLQARLLDHLGIPRLRAVIGGSLGGQQALEWALAFPERVEKCVVLAASARLSAQGLAFNAVGRFSIMNDPHFRGGDYYGLKLPQSGLAAARMLAHITYLSEEGMHEKFGRRATQSQDGKGCQFEVESYLNHQGRAFVERFDANSYLYISRAMDHYDAAAQWGGGDLAEACRRIRSEMLVVSFSTDWLYPPAHCRDLALAVTRHGHAVTYADVPSCYGHDAFLVETKPVGHLLRHFIARRA